MMSDGVVPRLDLAPKLDRPLSLWRPQDYLRLLYWVFFFPQALRWYVEKFGTAVRKIEEGKEQPSWWRQGWAFLRTSSIERNLFLQGHILIGIIPMALAFWLQKAGTSINWSAVMLGVGASMFASVTVLSLTHDSAHDMTYTVVVGLALGVGLGAPTGEMDGIALGAVIGAALGGGLGLAFSGRSGVDGGVLFHMALVVVYSVVVGVIAGALGSWMVYWVFDIAGIVAGVLCGGIVGGVASGVFIVRLPEYAMLAILGWKGEGRTFRWIGRATYLPLPGMKSQLMALLEQDAATGIARACYELFKVRLLYCRVWTEKHTPVM